jgi:branched-chain amino acid transport system ATP-binding protein
MPDPILEPPILEAENVSVTFGGVRALDHLSFAVHPGEVFGVIGPNGAGKTTLLNTISAVYRPSTGAVLLDGQPITGLPPHKLAKRGVARTFQIVQPFGHMTVRENVLVGAMFGSTVKHDAHQSAESALERTGLLPKAAFLPPQLTLAERKRLEVARALAMRPRILLLDEVMAGLNHTEIERVITLIKQLQADGLTIIVVEHVMRAVLALCSRLMVLNFGALLAEGPAAEVVANPRVIEAYLGTRFARMQAAPA